MNSMSAKTSSSWAASFQNKLQSYNAWQVLYRHDLSDIQQYDSVPLYCVAYGSRCAAHVRLSILMRAHRRATQPLYNSLRSRRLTSRFVLDHNGQLRLQSLDSGPKARG